MYTCIRKCVCMPKTNNFIKFKNEFIVNLLDNFLSIFENILCFG